MHEVVTIGLVGDRSDAVPAHRAIPIALDRVARECGVDVRHVWLATPDVARPALDACDGIWCVPGGPYRSMEGALGAIRHARESGTPFLGTCAGFQHAVVEFARNVLEWRDAAHAEVDPDAARAVVTLLECGLLDGGGRVRFLSGTKLAAAYGASEADEAYFCRYGVNPAFATALFASALRPAAFDDTGSLRAVELDGHPFFVATLFQPERAALADRTPPLVRAFVAVVAGGAS
jgi:CTP synthase (UTP-ammonia lyase)